MELRHLQYFKAVAEELNFRKAADRLFISQPGLSRQIRQLEELLGVQLFERDQKHVQLTPAGVYLKGEVDFVLNHLETTRSQLKQIDAGKIGELRIGFLGSASNRVLPDLLQKLNEKQPGITTSLEELSNAIQVEMIQKDRLDLGYVRMATVPEGLSKKTVLKDSFSVVVPLDHEVNSSNFKSLSQFSEEAFILFSSDYSKYYYDQIMGICRDAGFSPQIRHKSVHALTIFKLVENRMGVAIVPTSLKEGYELNVRFLEIPNTSQYTELSAIWKPENRNPALKRVLALL
ncbi:LysR family transcriptional regulator [Algoriphagus zhangzhouensis]|uniref:DNA-binding transcriptional regulator, LysR family n=1 Tax=Algoriphagus zhangzhouensis TaxID=1073327 RepID=A0A1M7Z7M8_9BACT|nr:LysR family transcriptional regulator [Algoriphagus zhangzhouensis]TDY49381.1 DNA-binding transcriptional LysR family regulator [Algoriphagus zhangzhouensis]SHO60854.1 DNA-binding transcriptional regulator, LysR family [Algoriphagus zhangzhouensis]